MLNSLWKKGSFMNLKNAGTIWYTLFIWWWIFLSLLFAPISDKIVVQMARVDGYNPPNTRKDTAFSWANIFEKKPDSSLASGYKKLHLSASCTFSFLTESYYDGYLLFFFHLCVPLLNSHCTFWVPYPSGYVYLYSEADPGILLQVGSGGQSKVLK